MNYTAETYSNITPVVFYGGGFCGGVDPRREEYAGANVAGVTAPNYKTKYEALQNVIKDNYAKFEVDYYGIDNDDYVNGEGFCCEPKAQAKNARSLPTENVDYERLQYYYHSDHLGSASYITNLDGEVVQHIEYVPFGEVFLEERNNTWNTPFLFNGKELDEETGLYYYGARYYNPRSSLWLSVDPPMLNGKFLKGVHNGGVYNSKNLGVYSYCYQNPISLIDPDGKQAYFIHGTNSSPKRWTDNSTTVLNRLTNNKRFNRTFSWEDLDGTTNNSNDRGNAARRLVDHVTKTRVEGEEITLIGHSNGGNVAIQAAKILYQETGEKVNLITIATPTYEAEDKNLNEDPGTALGQNSINDHLHIYNTIDGVQGGLAGDDTYQSSPKTRTFEIDVSGQYNSWEWLDAHSFDIEHPELIRNQMNGVKLNKIEQKKQEEN